MRREHTINSYTCDACGELIGQTTAPAPRFLHDRIAHSDQWWAANVGDYAGWRGFTYYYISPPADQHLSFCICERCFDVLEESNRIWLTIELMRGWQHDRKDV